MTPSSPLLGKMSESVPSQRPTSLTLKDECNSGAKEMILKEPQLLGGSVAASISFATPEHRRFSSAVSNRTDSLQRNATSSSKGGSTDARDSSNNSASSVTPPEKESVNAFLERKTDDDDKSLLLSGPVSLNRHIKEDAASESFNPSTTSSLGPSSSSNPGPLSQNIKIGESLTTSNSNPIATNGGIPTASSVLPTESGLCLASERTTVSEECNDVTPTSSMASQSIKEEPSDPFTSVKLDKKAPKGPGATRELIDASIPLSPIPSSSQQAKTPMRSPVSRQSFELPQLGSPGMLLSPYSTSLPMIPGSHQKDAGMAEKENDRSGGITPTNFAGADFGKHDLSSSSFDASHILAWCSPTAQHIFSPGGMINTPRGLFGGFPRTPRTPTNNPLFFSDPETPGNQVPSLNSSSDTNQTNKKIQGSDTGLPSMICVSPLTKRSNVPNMVSKPDKMRSTADKIDNHIDFKTVFASPKIDSSTSGSEKPQEILKIEKHMAERDLMEDEDLRLLLQLAQTTPRKNGKETKSTQVFRSPKSAKIQFGLRSEGLQLPFIGQNGKDTSPSKLLMKGHSRVNPQARTDDFTPPTISVRSKKTNNRSTGKDSMKIKTPARPPAKSSTATGNAPTLPRPVTAPGIYGGTGHPVQYGNAPLPPPHPGMHHAPHPGAYAHHPPPPMHMHPQGMPGHPPYHYQYPPSHPPPHPYSMYSNASVPAPSKPTKCVSKKDMKEKDGLKMNGKRTMVGQNSNNKKMKKSTSTKGKGSNKRSPKSVTGAVMSNPAERQKAAAAITAMNAAAGHKNDKAAALASAIMRGVTMRPSGKWQAQLYYAGKSRYIGVFDTREKAALAYEIAREKLKTDKSPSEQGGQSLKETEANVNAARKAAFEGVNEKDPRITG